jgi:hypothetical protein
MTDVLLFICVVGVLALALGCDIGALTLWLRSRWRVPR